jgi:hypothetical protein
MEVFSRDIFAIMVVYANREESAIMAFGETPVTGIRRYRSRGI